MPTIQFFCSGPWTCPEGVYYASADVTGGGGGGQAVTITSGPPVTVVNGAPGDSGNNESGGYAVTPFQEYQVVVGEGGSGGTGTNGGTGGCGSESSVFEITAAGGCAGGPAICTTFRQAFGGCSGNGQGGSGGTLSNANGGDGDDGYVEISYELPESSSSS